MTSSVDRVKRLAGLVMGVAVVSSASGCADIVDEANQHPACVYPSEPSDNLSIDPEGGPDLEFVADVPLWVGVDHGCAPCGDNLEMGCSVDLVGDELVIESTFNYEETRRPCDAACGLISSKCQTADPVPAGTYTVRYGDRSAMLEVPSQGPAPCFDRV